MKYNFINVNLKTLEKKEKSDSFPKASRDTILSEAGSWWRDIVPSFSVFLRGMKLKEKQKKKSFYVLFFRDIFLLSVFSLVRKSEW